MSEERLDGWQNLLTKLGMGSRDKRLSACVAPAPIFNQRQELDDLFHGNDLAQRICTLIPNEMVRQGIELHIENADGSNDMEMVKAACQRLDEMRLYSQLTDTMTWARLYGGACLYMGIDDGKNQAEAVDFNNIRRMPFLTVLDRHELRIVRRYGDPLQPEYGKPELYQLLTPVDPNAIQTGNVTYGKEVHASRLLHFDGAPTGRQRRRSINNGWADSIFCRLFDVIRGYDVTWISAEQLIQDFSQAVIKIKGLAEMMANQGEAKVRARLETLELSRSILRAMMLDADHEDFERKPTPMTGLPELLDRWLHRVSSAAEIPIALLFGMSPGGLNSTAEGDIEFFYNTIKTKQEKDLRPELEKFLKVLFNSKDGPTNGVEPQTWSFNFTPLWQMSDKEKADIRKTQAETDQIYLTQSVLSSEEIAISRFGGDEYSLETTLETTDRAAVAAAKAEADAQAQLAGQQVLASNPISPAAEIQGTENQQVAIAQGQ